MFSLESKKVLNWIQSLREAPEAASVDKRGLFCLGLRSRTRFVLRHEFGPRHLSPAMITFLSWNYFHVTTDFFSSRYFELLKFFSLTEI